MALETEKCDQKLSDDGLRNEVNLEESATPRGHFDHACSQAEPLGTNSEDTAAADDDEIDLTRNNQKTTKLNRHVTYNDKVDLKEIEHRLCSTEVMHEDGEHGYRTVFRNEMHRLHRELELFKEQIAKEYEKNAKRIEKKKVALEEEVRELEQRRSNARARAEEATDDTREGNAGGDTERVEDHDLKEKQLQQQHSLLDTELHLLDREEELSARQRQLEEYEAEIEKIEGYLDRRMEIAKRRTQELTELDEDRRELLELKAAAVTNDANVTGARADPPPAGVTEFQILQDRNSQMELALKKAKTDLARSENAREHLQSKVSGMEKSQRHYEKRNKELESQLSLNLSHSGPGRFRLSHAQGSNTDLQSLGSSMSQRLSITPASPADAPKPIRFSMKIRPTREQSQQREPQDEVVERPALAWQRYDNRRRSSRPTRSDVVGIRSAPIGRQRHDSVSTNGKSENSIIDSSSLSQRSLKSGSKVCSIQ